MAHFQFPGLSTYPFWWIVVDSPEERELCVVNPGREADVTIRSDPRTFCEIWTGDMSFRDAKRKKLITLEGQTVMVRSVSRWLKPGLLATGKLVDQI
ncbi:MAG: hypothetical protein O3A51_08035 [Verrucomicrobia bacterium]|nr:hypothetical protein [Verrucomicrobiota bacterium]